MSDELVQLLVPETAAALLATCKEIGLNQVETERHCRRALSTLPLALTTVTVFMPDIRC